MEQLHTSNPQQCWCVINKSGPKRVTDCARWIGKYFVDLATVANYIDSADDILK